MCLSECPILPSSIPHGFIQNRDLHKSLGFFRGKGHLGGSQYQFSCERGYSLVGAETLVCKDAGIWNDSLLSCLRGMCIFIVNRNVQHWFESVNWGLSSSSGPGIKSWLLLSRIVREYSLRRQPFLVHPLECTTLPSLLANGFIHGSGSLEGALYNFSCRKGYSLIGVDTVVYTDAGVWNGSLPTCPIGIWKIDVQVLILLP